MRALIAGDAGFRGPQLVQASMIHEGRILILDAGRGSMSTMPSRPISRSSSAHPECFERHIGGGLEAAVLDLGESGPHKSRLSRDCWLACFEETRNGERRCDFGPSLGSGEGWCRGRRGWRLGLGRGRGEHCRHSPWTSAAGIDPTRGRARSTRARPEREPA
jgi:hypothetical protein